MRNRIREWFDSRREARAPMRHRDGRPNVVNDRGGGQREWDIYGSPGYEDAYPRRDEETIFDRSPRYDRAPSPRYDADRDSRYGRSRYDAPEPTRREHSYSGEARGRDLYGSSSGYGRNSGYDRGYDHDERYRGGFSDFNRGDYTRAGSRGHFGSSDDRESADRWRAAEYDRSMRPEPTRGYGSYDDFDARDDRYGRGGHVDEDRDFDRLYNDEYMPRRRR